MLAGFFMRFTIRDWLWLTALIGVLAIWGVERGLRESDEVGSYHQTEEQAATIRELNERYRREVERRIRAENRLTDAEKSN
jgi:hypothetical protein